MGAMRLLYVHECFGAQGAAEAHIHMTATELRRRGHEVGLLHGIPTGKGEADWSATFAERYPWQPGSGAQQTRHALALFRPEAVFIHKIPDLAVLETLVASGLPLVRLVHDHDLYCMRRCRYAYCSRAICTRPVTPYCVFPCCAFLGRQQSGILPFKWISYRQKKREIQINQRFDRMVVASRYMHHQLVINGFDPARIEIHPPVPPMGPASMPSDSSERNQILYADTIIRGKGVDVLLESLALIRTPFECVIVGDGNHRSFCEKLSRRLGLDPRVCFKGSVPPQELEECYRQSRLMVVSSVCPEPFGTVGLEAMRNGLAVVAFDAGGIRDWLTDGHNGYLVRWMDRTAFAARIEQLLKDKAQARAMGARGLEKLNRDYDFARSISDLERLFSQVAQRIRS
jgi:glycosyltransferase involved in cell wall biosynthesis